MNWEKLTANDFAKAVKETQVCIITFGVVERHGDHLPLGTDFLNGHRLATLAAEIEPAVVFPPFYFGQIHEARCFPGTIAIDPQLLLPLVENLLDEIGRNGFEKIILHNAHGGNDAFLKYLAQIQLAKEKPYHLYLYNPFSAERKAFYEKVCDTAVHGHACECETSISLYNHASLVKMECIPKDEYLPLKRLSHVEQLFTGLSWYANYPTHYVGNASYATIEKGEKLVQQEAKWLAKFISQVKKDKVLSQLSQEFHANAKD